ncbi:MAG: phosphoadenosine phosphosulfate reductase family protein [Eubacteriales bacterium]|nr:phosphoadenosine phosphosulfate reductase family protein [Eubacteriales bacterium]
MKPLGRKQNIKNEEWLEAVANIESSVSRTDLLALEEETVLDIRAKTDGKKAAYAWSAGKDSIVLGHLCESAGIHECMIGVCNLEYPAFISWIDENKPTACEIINTGQDLDWLSRHPDMLFPQSSEVAGQWFHIVQHAAQARYFKAHDLGALILGRRRADGNFVGRGTNIYTDGRGVTRFSPLAGWKHEHILAYIHYHALPLPPIYEWPNGYLCGTHPWPARQWTGGIENGWREVYGIDPSIVISAAEKIESARRFLNGKEARA